MCARLGAREEGVLRQRDTYFLTARGRLKLREQEPGGAQLIHYERGDHLHARESSYLIAPVPDAEAMRALLDACLGTRGVVTKRRELFLWRGVRIHLDAVEELGSFLEFEAVVGSGSDLTREYGLIGELRAAFAITDEHLMSSGYADRLFP